MEALTRLIAALTETNDYLVTAIDLAKSRADLVLVAKLKARLAANEALIREVQQ